MRILFVCTGNTCRSPMAERIMSHKCRQAGLGHEVKSAGIAAVEGAPISPHARTVLQRKGINSEGGAQSVSKELVDWAELILTMTMNHKNRLVRQFPEAVDKVHTLKEFAIDDPETRRLRKEAEALAGEIQMKMALSQPIGDEERRRWLELEQALPSDDVADPFGGDLQTYEQTAEELEQLIDLVIRRLGSGNAAGADGTEADNREDGKKETGSTGTDGTGTGDTGTDSIGTGGTGTE